MYYAIENSRGARLSSYYPNEFDRKLVFRRTDWYSFQTRQEAEDFIKHIQTESKIGKNLVVVEEG